MGMFIRVPLANLQAPPPLDVSRSRLSWPEMWKIVCRELRLRGYQTSTIVLYRHVLRLFARFTGRNPCHTGPRDVDAFIKSQSRCSWSWMAFNIAVLRTVFDKFGRMSITGSLRTPKRPDSLPTVLSPDEVMSILRSARSVRDQLLLGLMYGCALKVSEVCSLCWQDIDLEAGTLTVNKGGNRDAPPRTVRFPPQVAGILQSGKNACRADGYVFAGGRHGRPLTTRMAGKILKYAVRQSGVVKSVCGMTLRHSCAVHCLQHGATIREVQVMLGHERIETTLIYERCLPPQDAGNPADRLDLPLTEAADHLLENLDMMEEVDRPFGQPEKPAHRLFSFHRDLCAMIRDRFLAPRRPAGLAATGPPG